MWSTRIDDAPHKEDMSNDYFFFENCWWYMNIFEYNLGKESKNEDEQVKNLVNQSKKMQEKYFF